MKVETALLIYQTPLAGMGARLLGVMQILREAEYVSH